MTSGVITASAVLKRNLFTDISRLQKKLKKTRWAVREMDLSALKVAQFTIVMVKNSSYVIAFY